MGDFHGGATVHDWESGLPTDITPLSYNLIPPELRSAFNIKPQPHRTAGDVAQASQKTISSLRCTAGAPVEIGDDVDYVDDVEDDVEVRKKRRNDSPGDADSAAAAYTATDTAMLTDTGMLADTGVDTAGLGDVKKARLVWTPQLHKRFVDVVAHLGIKSAVPKTIMQLMNVEGLTRENVASHLQKYRLYLKRMHNSDMSPAPESSPAPVENGHGGSGAVAMMGMGMGSYNGFEGHHNFHQSNNYHNYSGSSHHQQFNHNQQFNHHQQYGSNGVMQTGGSKFGSLMAYHPHNQGVE